MEFDKPITLEQATALARSQLSDQRFHHSLEVAKAAKALAVRLGADPEKAELAGVLHDLCKEWSEADLLKTLEGSDIIKMPYFRDLKAVWHGFAAAVYLEKEGFISSEIANAIAHHTSGKANMSPLEKAVFLADYISADRQYETSAQVREIAKTDINLACLTALRNSITHLMQKGKVVDVRSLEAYNWLLGELEV